MKLNVRCCCGPTKVFGTLDLPEPIKPMMNAALKDGRTASIQVRTLFSPDFAALGDTPIGDYLPMHEERAVYSEDRPIEFWRDVVGFREGAIVLKDGTFIEGITRNEYRGPTR